MDLNGHLDGKHTNAGQYLHLTIYPDLGDNLISVDAEARCSDESGRAGTNTRLNLAVLLLFGT